MTNKIVSIFGFPFFYYLQKKNETQNNATQQNYVFSPHSREININYNNINK